VTHNSFVFDNFLDLNIRGNVVIRNMLLKKMEYEIYTYDWLNVSESWCMIQVNRLDTCNPFSVIKHLMLLVIVVAWLHQGVKHDVAIEVDD